MDRRSPPVSPVPNMEKKGGKNTLPVMRIRSQLVLAVRTEEPTGLNGRMTVRTGISASHGCSRLRELLLRLSELLLGWLRLSKLLLWRLGLPELLLVLLGSAFAFRGAADSSWVDRPRRQPAGVLRATRPRRVRDAGHPARARGLFWRLGGRPIARLARRSAGRSEATPEPVFRV